MYPATTTSFTINYNVLILDLLEASLRANYCGRKWIDARLAETAVIFGAGEDFSSSRLTRWN